MKRLSLEQVSQRDYNAVYTCGPFILQIMQDSQHDGIVIGLTPEVTIAFNNGRSHVAIGLDWICGCVNVAIMTKEFRKSEEKRREDIKTLAAKDNLTIKQVKLRHGW